MHQEYRITEFWKSWWCLFTTFTKWLFAIGPKLTETYSGWCVMFYYANCSIWIVLELASAPEHLMMIMQLQMPLRFMTVPGMQFCFEVCLPLQRMKLTWHIYLISGAVHFMASNNDCGVRDFDMERFQLSKHFHFPWPVNVSYPTSETERERGPGPRMSGWMDFHPDWMMIACKG